MNRQHCLILAMAVWALVSCEIKDPQSVTNTGNTTKIAGTVNFDSTQILSRKLVNESLEGLRVNLSRDSITVFDSTRTNDVGYYEFSDMDTGTWVVSACYEDDCLYATVNLPDSSSQVNANFSFSDSDGVVSFSVSECQTMSVLNMGSNYRYTWIEPYADGHYDTIWSSEETDYYGTEEVKWFFCYACGNDLFTYYETYPLVVDTLVCPGDSLVATSSDYLLWKSAMEDTVWLNWGDSAQDSLVEPIVSIGNKDSLIVALDTAVHYFQTISQTIEALHFAGDSLKFSFSSDDTSLIHLFVDVGEVLTVAPNPCSDSSDSAGGLEFALVKDWTGENFYPYLSVYPSITDSAGFVGWKLVIENRFGYRDSVEGTTTLLSYSGYCEDTSNVTWDPEEEYDTIFVETDTSSSGG
ncbi:MAG TPA: hypothetical protein VLM37_00305 [Fibrobacteraceae bacterium]|nr:hypothetical protein [Fibrobacteraceae bacterium]